MPSPCETFTIEAWQLLLIVEKEVLEPLDSLSIPSLID